MNYLFIVDDTITLVNNAMNLITFNNQNSFTEKIILNTDCFQGFMYNDNYWSWINANSNHSILLFNFLKMEIDDKTYNARYIILEL